MWIVRQFISSSRNALLLPSLRVSFLQRYPNVADLPGELNSDVVVVVAHPPLTSRVTMVASMPYLFPKLTVIPGRGGYSLRCDETSTKHKRDINMDALPFIIERLSETSLKEFLSNNGSHDLNNLEFVIQELVKVQRYMRWSNFNKNPDDQKQALINGLRLTVRRVGKFMSTIDEHDSSTAVHDQLVKEWGHILSIIAGIVYCCYLLKNNQVEKEYSLEEVCGEDFDEMERICNIPGSSDGPESFYQQIENLNSLNEQQSLQLFLLKAFPVLTEHHDPSQKKTFLRELSKELDNLPQLICKACNGLPLALVLVGSLLSLKEKINDIWTGVKDDLCNENNDCGDRLSSIINYCYEDLPYFLKPCFLYLTCFPKGHKIPARSLINMWIAEGFISTEGKEKTLEEAAHKYLDQLVKRSLVDVKKRSSLGTIKYCCVNPVIHQFAINKSKKEGFLVANPDVKTIESLFRLAIHSDNNSQYGEIEIHHMHSFLTFNSQQNIPRNARYLRVLELWESTAPSVSVPKMNSIRYLGLRRAKIETIPESIEAMQNLQTLDVRDTKIETLPESIWNISALRHVYVSNTEIRGPPPTAKITELQTLKTVAVPKTWLDKCPQFLISLRKLALSNPDRLDWSSVSNLLTLLVNLLSLTVIGDSVPSEFVDTRAFPNLETVKSIRLEGMWICRKLFIDNVKFPPNLTKLTLSKSGLKEDPMPRLEKLETLKFLSLQDEAYTGEKMVCSAGGFPQLQFLELNKLTCLEKLVVEAMAMLKLSSLRVVLCGKINNNIPNLGHVTSVVIN